MPQALTREFIESFYRARLSRDAECVGPYLDDNVDWLITGPVELLHFCGQRRGKTEVLDTIVRVMPTIMHVSKVELEALLIDRDRAATFSRLTGCCAAPAASSAIIRLNSCTSATGRSSNTAPSSTASTPPSR